MFTSLFAPSSRGPLSAEPSPLGWLDAVGIALLCALLLVLSYLQGRHRMFWGDEIMGDFVLNAGSWQLFFERWRAGIDSSGIWFYVFAKPWEWVFGPSELSLRLFSAAGLCTAAGLLWVTARRYYGLVIVAASVSLVFLDIDVLRWQLSNGRCYGVLMAAAAWVLYLILREGEGPDRRSSVAFLLVTALAYDVLAGSHILGMLYAGALLAMQIGLDLRARRLRLPLYAAAAVGIVVVVLFSIPNIHSTTALGKPVFWTVRPLLKDLFLASDLTDSPVRLALFVLLAVTLIALRRRPARVPVYLILLGFALLDAVFFVISRLGTSIYVDRYLLPFAFALVLLAAELLTQLREADASFRWLRGAAPFLLAAWLVYSLPPLHFFPYPQRDYTGSVLARMDYLGAIEGKLPPGLPVVDTDVGSFVEIEHYHHGAIDRPFFFPMDPGVTADPHNFGGVSGLHEMENFERLGLDMPDLQPTDAILSRYPHLLVIAAQVPTVWLAKRITDTGAYTVRDLGPLPGFLPLRLWEAQRR